MNPLSARSCQSTKFTPTEESQATVGEKQDATNVGRPPQSLCGLLVGVVWCRGWGAHSCVEMQWERIARSVHSLALRAGHA